MNEDPFLEYSVVELWRLADFTKTHLSNPQLTDAEALNAMRELFIELKEMHDQALIISNSNSKSDLVIFFIKKFSYFFTNVFQPLYKKWVTTY